METKAAKSGMDLKVQHEDEKAQEGSIHPMVSFFTLGQRHNHKESYIIINQSYVGYRPATPQHGTTRSVPILFIHGGGLTGAMWESTPDLRPGWAADANSLGYHSYILDKVDHGRSQRAPDDLRSGKVEHRTALYVWERFRIGTFENFDSRKPFEESQFPVDHLDALIAAQSARRRTTDDVETGGILDAVKQLGKCHLIAHSHGAALVMGALDELKPFVERVVLVEPGGTAKPELLQADIPTLVVWGDYLHIHPVWTKIEMGYKSSPVDILDLPNANIKGNSHLLMLERNSKEIFGMIANWLEGGPLK